MKFGSLELDGGSLIIGSIVAVSAAVALTGGRQQLDTRSLVLAIGTCATITCLFIWQSVRIGGNRQRIRDVARWMGEKSDTRQIK